MGAHPQPNGITRPEMEASDDPWCSFVYAEKLEQTQQITVQDRAGVSGKIVDAHVTSAHHYAETLEQSSDFKATRGSHILEMDAERQAKPAAQHVEILEQTHYGATVVF